MNNYKKAVLNCNNANIEDEKLIQKWKEILSPNITIDVTNYMDQ